MTDRYDHSRSKSHKDYKYKETSRSKGKYYRDGSQRQHAESRTPPLPTRRTSIEELIKRRDTLKKELKKMTKHSDSHLASKYEPSISDKNKKHSRDYTTNIHNRKSSYDNDLKPKSKKIVAAKDSTECNGDFAAESEDEETLIAKSRQRRKQFMDSFQVSKDSKYDINYIPLENTKDPTNEDKNVQVEEKTSAKKTADMFADNDDFTPTHEPEHITQDNSEKNNLQLTDNWDDDEGYYNVRVGDQINQQRYTIKSILGQGVFSNVVRAQDNVLKSEVAIKIIRNNEIIYKTGLKEIAILKEISNVDPENKYHCVQMITHFMHKNHLCIVLESMYMDMRSVVKKYGKQHGINLKALTSYSRQLLVALRLLKKMGIVHADIKPDNILVNEKKNVLKLCDFGSASKVDIHEATPYLVSRFYRAPEIILGIPYKHSIDIWSTACTMYEMATGKILFAGNCNNRMLKCFMDLKGKFSSKVIRKGKFKDQHFNYNNNFLLHKKDEISGREKLTEVTNIVPSRDLLNELKKHFKNLNDKEEKKLFQLRDILDKMLILDMNHRSTVSDCLRHPFVQEELQK